MRRPLVLLRASRETVVVLACATALTLALAHTAHRHRDMAPAGAPSGSEIVRQDWAGNLADLAPATVHAAEPLTSASLIVPKEAMPAPVAPAAPPAVPVSVAARQPAPAKVRPCDQTSCAAAKPAPQLVAALPARPAAEPVRLSPEEKPTLINKFNPLKHLPDAVRHPFDYAGDAVTSWIRRL